MNDGRRDPPRTGEQPDQPRGELSARARIDRDEQSFDIGNKALRLELLALQSRRLLRPSSAAAPSAQRSIGGIDIVVTTAIATIVVNRF